jgi:hypothetical protein
MSMDVVAAMAEERPYKTYKKTILGKVAVKVYNPLKQAPEEVILQGDPSKNDKGCFVDVWSEQENVYLKRMNERHMREGVLLLIEREALPVIEDVNEFNVMTDEELNEVLNSPFFTLRNALNKMTSEAPVQRLITLAEEQEKSEKILQEIRARLAELQELDFTDAS